jgi:Ni,Fe-hydrogenase III large subunit
MPGLQGLSISEEEVNDLKKIFKNHKEIIRSVKIISNAISTITETKNEDLRGAIVKQVVGMVARLEAVRDPQIIIQCPTLD